MKKIRNVVMFGMVFGVLASFASAKILKVTFGVPLPGIKGNGNLNFNDLGPGQLTLKANTRSGRVTARAKGQVHNHSGHKQVFRNDDIIGPVIDELGGPSGVTLDDVNDFLAGNAKIRRLRYTVRKPHNHPGPPWAKATGVGVAKVNKDFF